MPEIKNTFLQGKMNKDLDERLVPNGQYRDAVNVEVSTAEDSNIGVVKNILGSHRIDSIINSEFSCVGSISDEKTNKLYWFVSSYEKDAIIEYDTVNDVVSPVIVDLKAGSSEAVLEFDGNIITGINIIDDLLFWTDNNSEPKKINITTCKNGTADFNSHTQLSFENGSFDGITISLVSPWSGNQAGHSSYFDGTNTQKTGRYAWVEQSNLVELVNPGGTHIHGLGNFEVKHYRNGEFLGVKEIKANTSLSSFRTAQDWAGTIEGSAANALPELSHLPDSDFTSNTFYLRSNHPLLTWHVGDVVFANDKKIDIRKQHVTVIKQKPLNSFSVKINHSDDLNSKYNTPNLFETTFPRFSYRYKFRDGEYSAMAPFTDPVFNPKYPKDTSVSNESNVFYHKDNAYDIKEPHNKAMTNSIHSVELFNFITSKTPEDVIEIEILYKQENSTTVYSIDTIKHIDAAWHVSSDYEGQGLKIGSKKHPNGIAWYLEGGGMKGRYTVTTENIYAALPANQLLRPWDNVPKKALAQEVTGNRIVYGNYVQNYDLSKKSNVVVSYSDRKNSQFLGSFEAKGLPSIKSQRNYQLGVVYCDRYGRETPVFTSKNAAVTVPWQDQDGSKNASKSLQLNAATPSNLPEWVDSLKFFIKENSNEYYNLVMDRAWVTKSTYELDDSEGHLWISFPSSDRNKITENDYIILKKKIGADENQIDFENKFKILDISNEAPDAIKYELVNMGTASNNGDTGLTSTSTGSGLLYSASNRIDVEGAETILIRKSQWQLEDGYRASLSKDQGGVNQQERTPLLDNLYISWRRIADNFDDNAVSKKYKVIGGWTGEGAYVMKLESPITKIDADIAHRIGDANVTKTHLHHDLIFQVERKVLKESEDFSGKFFIKISKNQVTDLIETGNNVSILDQFAVKGKSSVWYWQDKIGSTVAADTGNYGLLNYGGYANTYAVTSTNGIHGEDTGAGAGEATFNNGWGNTVGGTDGGSTMKVSDFAAPWEGMYSNFSTKSLWFIDSMHIAAGQSDASDYAKYCCITWSGCTKGSDTSAEESSWSYPPLKQWLSDFNVTTQMILPPLENPTQQEALAHPVHWSQPASVWHNNNLITTNIGFPRNTDYQNLKVDGWAGPLQKVDRNVPGSGNIAKNHVNGLEGIVTTSPKHSKGPRRWFSGMTGKSHGVGINTDTYANSDTDTGRHFMHLSFFAPGKDLHDGDWSGMPTDNGFDMVYGPDSFGANLQGIWGGGVFTGESQDERFGASSVADEDKFIHFPMEGNYASDFGFLPEVPGPGVGYGYDERYRELHERQWDPTFTETGDPDNKIRDFIRNLHAGARFRFHRWDTPGSTLAAVIDDTVYTIKKVHVKKLYNHTSWRKPYNRWSDGGYKHNDNQDYNYRSVEQCALDWLKTATETDNGMDALSGKTGPSGKGSGGLMKKITDFGAAHNRRVCYIIELDKNPTVNVGQAIGNVLSGDKMTADFNHDNFTDIEFLDPVKDYLLTDLNKFPAIWELDPKKKDVDLDIYYEASRNIPVKINNETNEIFAPIGCTVEIIDANITGSSILQSWDNHTAILNPGFKKGDNGVEIDYTGMSFKFIRRDGSYTVAEAGLQDLDGGSDGNKTEFIFREDVGEVISSGLSWNNCFSFGNGIESNRIRDDFNEQFITNGVKASTTIQEAYREERRKNGLIYSGIYNSTSGVNDLNQFIMAEKITKDLNPVYGSIQKLFSRDSDLVTFCEDKVVKVLANKDALFNADGNTNLTATENVLGQSIPFVGDYGISKNPESFASESYRAYFTDKQRGAVLRLSRDGLTPISKAGMHDWFRDNLPQYNSLIGSYDNYKENYNLTLSNNNFNENLLVDSVLDIGDVLEEATLGSLNIITNPIVSNGTNLQYLYNYSTYDVLEYENSSNVFDWSPFDYDAYNLKSLTKVIHHAAIGVGELQQAVAGQAGQAAVTAVTGQAAVYTAYANGTAVATGGTAQEAIDNAAAAGYVNVTASAFQSAVYQGPQDFFTTVNIGSYADDIWSVGENDTSTNNDNELDPNRWSTPRRKIAGTLINESASSHNFPFSYGTSYNPSVEKEIVYNVGSGSFTNLSKISQAITRSDSNGEIYFDRVPSGSNSYLEFRAIGHDEAGANEDYTGDPYAYNTQGIRHRSFFNGDELEVQVTLRVYNTSDLFKGYNYIKPVISITNGNTVLNYDYFVNVPANVTSYTVGTENNTYRNMHSNGGYFTHPTNTSANQGAWDDDNLAGNTHSKCVKGPQSNGSVHFPNTNSINWPTGSDSIEIVVGCVWKFRDVNQQWSSGSRKSGVANIEEVMLLDDLRIRIWNSHGYSDSGYGYSNQQGQFPLRNPLWSVKKIQARKNYGIQSPHTDPVSGVSITQAQTTAFIEAVEGQDYEPEIHAVDAVPPHPVPAWTEVVHSWLTGWDIEQNAYGSGGGGNSRHLHAHTTAKFGNNYTKQEVQGFGQNTSDIAAAPNEVIKYYVPNDWGYLGVNGGPPSGGSPYGTQGANASNPSGISFNRVNASSNNDYPTATEANGGLVPYNNPYLYIRNNMDPANFASGWDHSALDIEYDITDDPWTVDTWYLVDMEIDPLANTGILDPNEYGSGSGLSGGYFRVWGVLTDPAPVNYNWNNHISSSTAYDDAWVGCFSGGHFVKLVPVLRKEYGVEKMVLRGIFKITANSKIFEDPTWKNKLTIRAIGINNAVRVEKIITKKLNSGSTWTNWINGNGRVNNGTWNLSAGNNEEFEAQHAFQKKEIYLFNNKLHWEVPGIHNEVGGDFNTWAHTWSQKFGENVTNPAPQVSTELWELSFTVSDNEVTGDFSGRLRGFIAIEDTSTFDQSANNGAGGGGFQGVYFDGIDKDGNYLIRFNFNGDTTGWEFRRAELGEDPSDLNNSTDFTNASGNLQEMSTYTHWPQDLAKDKIVFMQDYIGQDGVDQRYAVSDISLTDSYKVFLGGSAGSWSFDGFNTSTDNYIYWDEAAENLVFENAIPVDVNAGGLKFINVNQQIDATINQFEKYEVRLDHTITPSSTATLSIYYYNSNGWGFKITDINHSTTVNHVVTIGELDPNGNPMPHAKWSHINELNNAYDPDLKNSFVIEVNGTPGQLLDGTIDNISMRRIYTDSNFEDKTISFSEGTNGWISFKSFVAENGVSVSKKYFTFDNGALHQHYIPKVNGSTYKMEGSNKIYYTPQEADNYNKFHDDPSQSKDSSITAVLNNESSLVKTFNTLGYEGSQGYILPPASESEITPRNANAWGTIDGIKGWECQEIKTDLDVGSIKEFIKKEGKWFNYIRGKNVNNNIDTSLLSFQGVGVISSVG